MTRQVEINMRHYYPKRTWPNRMTPNHVSNSLPTMSLKVFDASSKETKILNLLPLQNETVWMLHHYFDVCHHNSTSKPLTILVRLLSIKNWRFFPQNFDWCFLGKSKLKRLYLNNENNKLQSSHVSTPSSLLKQIHDIKMNDLQLQKHRSSLYTNRFMIEYRFSKNVVKTIKKNWFAPYHFCEPRW